MTVCSVLAEFGLQQLVELRAVTLSEERHSAPTGVLRLAVGQRPSGTTTLALLWGKGLASALLGSDSQGCLRVSGRLGSGIHRRGDYRP